MWVLLKLLNASKNTTWTTARQSKILKIKMVLINQFLFKDLLKIITGKFIFAF